MLAVSPILTLVAGQLALAHRQMHPYFYLSGLYLAKASLFLWLSTSSDIIKTKKDSLDYEAISNLPTSLPLTPEPVAMAA